MPIQSDHQQRLERRSRKQIHADSYLAAVVASAADLLKWLYDLVLPHYCPLCRQPSSSYLCSECWDRFRTNEPCCTHCAVPLESNHTVCGDCLKSPPAFRRALSLFVYRDIFATLIFKLKKHDDSQAIHQIGTAMSALIRKHYTNEHLPQLLIPVPIHWRKRWQRGFNLSELICRELSSQLDLPRSNAISKRKPTAMQKTLRKKQRQKNLEGSFSVKQNQIANKHVAIIDDVMTTGSTASALAKLCLHSGAKSVDVWTIARTPKAIELHL